MCCFYFQSVVIILLVTFKGCSLQKPQRCSHTITHTWVVRTDDIQEASTLCPEPLGAIEPMSRGSLNWYITIPADGSVPLDGVAPALIEWQTDVHPAANLEDIGISLVKLEIFHPAPQRLTRLLSAIGAAGPIVVSTLPDGRAPHLVATINTPHGPRLLSSPVMERKNNG